MRQLHHFWVILAGVAFVLLLNCTVLVSNEDSAQHDAAAGSTDSGTTKSTDPGPDVATLVTGCETPIKKSFNSSKNTDVFSWQDSSCKPRSAGLVRKNTSGGGGGFLSDFTYDVNGSTRSCSGYWGTVGNHLSTGGAVSSNNYAGTYRDVFVGKHHAVHEFTFDMPPANVTIHWLFETGRNDPLFSITFNVKSGTSADTRAPYNDFGFDGDANSAVVGIGWGDKYKFVSTGSNPVDGHSGWDYSRLNVIPYVHEWTSAVDAEMGIVETRAWADSISGGDYSNGGQMLADCWGRTSSNRGNCQAAATQNCGTTMPVAWIWPYQLNQYSYCFGPTSKRLCWGTDFGAIGKSSYSSFGRENRVGYPHVTFAVWMVLGKHSENAVGNRISDMENVLNTILTASRGTVATTGFNEYRRTDTTTWKPVGWNHVYATWDVTAASNSATMQMVVPNSKSIVNPVFRVLNYTSTTPPSKVTLNGSQLKADSSYFASIDTADKVLWLTLASKLSGTNSISIE